MYKIIKDKTAKKKIVIMCHTATKNGRCMIFLIQIYCGIN